MGTQSHHKFPLLDALRGLAALSVLLVHTSIWSGAVNAPWYGPLLGHLDIGVAFFFLLSAFLLYRPFVKARVTGAQRGGFGDYGRRRFVRIAPAYWVALTITAIVPGMVGAFSGDWWAYYGLLQNFPVYTATGTCANASFACGIPVAWSLTIEVLFYMMLPLFVLAMAWLGKRWRGHWLTLELSVLAALSVISVGIQGSTPGTDLHKWLFYSPIGRGWWFGLGLALAAISVHAGQLDREPTVVGWLRRRPGVPVTAALVLYVIAAIAIPGPSLAFPTIGLPLYVTQYVLFGVIAALVMMPAVFGIDGGGLVRRALGHRSLAWLGLISYGVFLWHYAVIIFLLEANAVWSFVPLTVATLALTVPCAAASYYLLERPLMRWARRRTPAPAPAAAASAPGPAA